jgi:hypothetical protein
MAGGHFHEGRQKAGILALRQIQRGGGRRIGQRAVAHLAHADDVEGTRQHRHAAARRHQADDGGRFPGLHRNGRLEAGLPAQAVDLRMNPGAGALRIHHQRFPFQIIDGDAVLLRQRMADRQHHHQRIAPQHRQLHRFRQRELGRPHQPRSSSRAASASIWPMVDISCKVSCTPGYCWR